MNNSSLEELNNRLNPDYRPQDDFFNFVNSKWLQANPIPSDEMSWGPFHILRKQSREQVKGICEEIENQQFSHGTIEQKVADLYWTGVYKDELEGAHRRELKAEYDKIEGIDSIAELYSYLGFMHSRGLNPMWSFGVDYDRKDSSVYVVQIYQDGLSMPDRDYYLGTEDRYVKLRQEFTEFIAELTDEFDFAAGKIDPERILHYETQIAESHNTAAELRDIEKTYNPRSVDELKIEFPKIDWDAYFAGMGWQPSGNIVIENISYIEFINRLSEESYLEAMKGYLRWHLLVALASAVSEPMARISFGFFGIKLSGQKEQKPVQDRTVMMMNQIFGQAVGKIYAKKYFPSDRKKKVEQLVEDVRTAFATRIEKLEWMQPESKAYALKKLANMKVLVGYGVDPRDYSRYEIDRTSFLNNYLSISAAEFSEDMKRVGRKPNRDEMFMSPQTVNAYNDPGQLVIAFPAAILQPPFYNEAAPDYVNFAGIGSVTGHELTHGFDDNGCKYDAEGNMRNWRTDAENESFSKEAKKLSDLADQFEVLPDVFMRGALVLGESIADLGGLEIALDAYKVHVAKTENRTATQDEIQNYYKAYTMTECTAVTDEQTVQYALADPHPLSKFRVDGIVRHCDDFYSAFELKPSDKLYLSDAERVRIW
jgi:putative endopeptidase